MYNIEVAVVVVPFVMSQTTGRHISEYFLHTLPKKSLVDQRLEKTLEKLALHNVGHSFLLQS